MLIKMDHPWKVYVDNGRNFKFSIKKTLRQLVKSPSRLFICSLHLFTSIQSVSISIPQPLKTVFRKGAFLQGNGFPGKLLILNIVQFRCKKALAVWGPAHFAVISIQNRQNTAVCALNKTSGSWLECMRSTDSLLLEIWSLQNKMWQLSGDARWNCGVMIKIFWKP